MKQKVKGIAFSFVFVKKKHLKKVLFFTVHTKENHAAVAVQRFPRNCIALKSICDILTLTALKRANKKSILV